MLLDEARRSVTQVLDAEDALGVQIQRVNDVPSSGPVNKGVWQRIDDVTAVFVDIKRSTALNVQAHDKEAARAYTYFIKSMARVADQFGARYMDVQGDALFALFSGPGSVFDAFAAAVTMRTLAATELATRLQRVASSDWTLACAIGMDRKTVLVRRLGLRGAKENEVWAGKPVSMAAGLSSLADDNELLVSERVYACFETAKGVRRRAIIWSCGCESDVPGPGLDDVLGTTPKLWREDLVPSDGKLDFDRMYRLRSPWCWRHGAEFCETIVTGARP